MSSQCCAGSASEVAADVAASSTVVDGDASLLPLLNLQAVQQKREMEYLMRLHPVTNADVAVRRGLEDLIRLHLRHHARLEPRAEQRGPPLVSDLTGGGGEGEAAPTSRVGGGAILERLDQWNALSQQQAVLMSSVRDDVILANEARESELLAMIGLHAVSTRDSPFPSETSPTLHPFPPRPPPVTEARRTGVTSSLVRRWTNMEAGEVRRSEGGVDGVLGSGERERVRQMFQMWHGRPPPPPPPPHPPTSRDGLLRSGLRMLRRGTGGRQGGEGEAEAVRVEGQSDVMSTQREVGEVEERRAVSGMARSFRDRLEMMVAAGPQPPHHRPEHQPLQPPTPPSHQPVQPSERGTRSEFGSMRDTGLARRQGGGDLELDELLSRRSVSTALASNFRTRLDHLMQSLLLRRQTAHTLTPPRHGDAPTPPPPLSSRPPPPPPPPPHPHTVGAGRQWDGRGGEEGRARQYGGRSGRAEQDGAAEMRMVESRLLRLEILVQNVAEMVAEVQRSFRQEVAGAMTRLYEGRGGEVPAEALDGSRWVSVRSGVCCVCCDRSIDVLLYRCGHMCTCHECALELTSHGATCPMCRAPVVEVVRAYTMA